MGIFLSFNTFRNLYNTGEEVDWFTIAAFANVDVVAAEKNVKDVLKKLHKVAPEDDRAFVVQSGRSIQ